MIMTYKETTDYLFNCVPLFQNVGKEAYKEALSYKNCFYFREKSFPKVYRYASVSGYWIFCMTCFLFAMYQKYKKQND